MTEIAAIFLYYVSAMSLYGISAHMLHEGPGMGYTLLYSFLVTLGSFLLMRAGFLVGKELAPTRRS